MTNQPDIVISTPIPYVKNDAGEWRLGLLTVEWHRSRMRLCTPNGYKILEQRADGMEIGAARNYVAEQALACGAEWLFFIDWDVLMPANCLKQLIYRTKTHPGYDIYSGVYCLKEHPANPIICKEGERGWFLDWKIGDVLTEGIAAVPMGCALLRVATFAKLPQEPENPWFKTHVLDDENGPQGRISEDIWYCNRVVQEAGGKILVDCTPNCLCGHIDPATAEIFVLEADSPAMRSWPEWLKNQEEHTNLVSKP